MGSAEKQSKTLSREECKLGVVRLQIFLRRHECSAVKEIASSVARIAILFNPDNPGNQRLATGNVAPSNTTGTTTRFYGADGRSIGSASTPSSSSFGRSFFGAR
jgi:hypothetical protein